MKYKESELKKYAEPIGKTQDEKCKNAIGMISDALLLSHYRKEGEIAPLYEGTGAYAIRMTDVSNNKITIFVQGSYANGTNIKEDSDVDIAAILESTFWADYREGIDRTNYGFTSSSMTLKKFKDDIETQLRLKFATGVRRGNKSIKVNGNTYRINADVVPCGRYRDYRNDFGFDESNCIKGIRLEPDSGAAITNYPEQHIENGKKKNVETNYLFKKMTRIMKNIRNDMESSYSSAKKVGSFQLESLIWNIPTEVFLKYSSNYRFTFDEVVTYLYDNKNVFSKFKEANGIKHLFPDSEMLSLYQTFIGSLKKHYEYDITE